MARVVDSQEPVYTVTKRYIAKCAVKGCRGVSSALVEETRQHVYSAINGRRVGTSELSYQVLEGDWYKTPWGYRPRTSPCGHGSMITKAVKGTPTEKPCDARCMNARGTSCDCSCGGKNHGSGHCF